MKGEAVLLAEHDRETVEAVCEEHCDLRGWILLARNAQTNHVQVVVMAEALPRKVRDQLKANCANALRRQKKPVNAERTWTEGGDCEIVDTDHAIESAVVYVKQAQDRMDRESDW